MKRPTISDVAREAGVSPTSVSFAFNQPTRISDGTRERIIATAETLGYSPDPVARSMSIGRTGTIGVLVPQPLPEVVHNPYFSEFLAGVAEAAEDGDLPIMLVGPRQGSIERAVYGAAVDGLLTVGLEPFRPTIQVLTARRLPYVMVDSEPVDGIACVNADDESGAEAAMKHVLDAGHRQIGILGIESPEPGHWESYVGTLGRRVAGYRNALEAAGLSLDDVALVECPVSEAGGRNGLRQLMDSPDPPSAVVSMSDLIALGALAEARITDIEVPRDLSIVGYDDIPEAHWSDPPLTTVRQPSSEKGKVAAELLIGLIDDTAEPVHIVLDTELVKRGSVSERNFLTP